MIFKRKEIKIKIKKNKEREKEGEREVGRKANKRFCDVTIWTRFNGFLICEKRLLRGWFCMLGCLFNFWNVFFFWLEFGRSLEFFLWLLLLVVVGCGWCDLFWWFWWFWWLCRLTNGRLIVFFNHYYYSPIPFFPFFLSSFFPFLPSFFVLSPFFSFLPSFPSLFSFFFPLFSFPPL